MRDVSQPPYGLGALPHSKYTCPLDKHNDCPCCPTKTSWTQCLYSQVQTTSVVVSPGIVQEYDVVLHTSGITKSDEVKLAFFHVVGSKSWYKTIGIILAHAVGFFPP